MQLCRVLKHSLLLPATKNSAQVAKIGLEGKLGNPDIGVDDADRDPAPGVHTPCNHLVARLRQSVGVPSARRPRLVPAPARPLTRYDGGQILEAVVHRYRGYQRHTQGIRKMTKTLIF